MADVKVLVPGYTSAATNGHSCSTVSLVQDKDINMIVDPGTVADQSIITAKLAEHDLTVKDINIVFLTHAHIDHYRNIGMFPNAKSLSRSGWHDKDFWSEGDGKINNNLTYIHTPGHSNDSITLLVKSEMGSEETGSIEYITAVCGDVFWEEGEPKYDKFANDQKILQKSRLQVLKLADYIVPGHADIYQVKK